MLWGWLFGLMGRFSTRGFANEGLWWGKSVRVLTVGCLSYHRVRYDGISSEEEDFTLPAKDLYHDAVKSALLKDGWQITADPYRIIYKGIDLYADLAAERPIAATREGEKIVVEIKSFVGRSLMNDLHGAVGQYVIYRDLIRETEPEYRLYLAIDDITYENFFRREGIDFLRRTNQIPLIIVDIEKEEIVQWIS